MTYAIRGIPNEMVGKVWSFAEPFIKRALDHTFGELSHEDLMRMVMARDAQLWMITRSDKRVVGAGTTQIVTYPQVTACRIITLAGTEFDGWREEAHALIETWAKSMGCKCMENYVRKGFVPKLIDMGYKHRYSVMHKDL
jgi:hypothetical protein